MWSNKDKWGRTPYTFQDFVMCKYWNVIPNNRLITLRKYAVPTYDNLNFHNMTDGNRSGGELVTAPIATVLTYFGGDSPNKLDSILKFMSGTKWKDIQADVHKVSGDTGSNPRAVIDSMFEGGGFGGVGSKSSIVNAMLGKAGGLTGQYFSFGKFVGLLSPDGYTGHNQAAFDKMTQANVDPQDSLYENRIIGPVNRVQAVKAREAGIEFSNSLSITCEWIARPIGGLNQKAVMLDILANAMEIASPQAVFWGGGYRFEIKPHLYPFKRTDNFLSGGSVMDALYQGKIFGSKGAIAAALSGFKEFGTNPDTGKFEWTTVTGQLGNVLSTTIAAIGNVLQSVSSALFGEASSLSQWIKGATEGGGTEEEKKARAEKAKTAVSSMFGNLNKMWKDQVIQETTMPSIQGMKSILTGEPTGNWHLTIGNPLNPIAVIGNLICPKMDFEFGDELGPDDFPTTLKVTYSLEHAMFRDKAAIQSMFNKGGGKIYKLPDYIKASSNYESKVDKFTGRMSDYMTPAYMNAGTLMKIGGASGYQRYKIFPGQALTNGQTSSYDVQQATFVPFNRQDGYQFISPDQGGFLGNTGTRQVFFSNMFTRKRSDN